MKKILKARNSKRNEKLFSKLFENQGIEINLEGKTCDDDVNELGVPEMTAWQANEELLDEEDSQTVDTSALESLLRQISDKLDSLEDIDISIDYLTAALTGIDPDVANKGQAVFGRELGADVREGEGHVVIAPPEEDMDDDEDIEDLEEETSMKDAHLARIQKQLKPVANVLRTVDTPQETIQIVNFLLKSIVDLSNGQLTNSEMKVALKSLVGDLKEAKASK